MQVVLVLFDFVRDIHLEFVSPPKKNGREWNFVCGAHYDQQLLSYEVFLR